MAPLKLKTKEQLLRFFKFSPALPDLAKEADEVEAIVVFKAVGVGPEYDGLRYLSVGPDRQYKSIEQTLEQIAAFSAATKTRNYPLAIYSKDLK